MMPESPTGCRVYGYKDTPYGRRVDVALYDTRTTEDIYWSARCNSYVLAADPGDEAPRLVCINGAGEVRWDATNYAWAEGDKGAREHFGVDVRKTTKRQAEARCRELFGRAAHATFRMRLGRPRYEVTLGDPTLRDAKTVTYASENGFDEAIEAALTASAANATVPNGAPDRRLTMSKKTTKTTSASTDLAANGESTQAQPVAREEMERLGFIGKADAPAKKRSRKTRAAEAAAKPTDLALVPEPTPEPAPEPQPVADASPQPEPQPEPTPAPATKEAKALAAYEKWVATAKAYDARMKEMGPAHQNAALVHNTYVRMTQLVGKLEALGTEDGIVTAIEALRTALPALVAAEGALKTLPYGWKPAPKTAKPAPKTAKPATNSLAVGTRVSVREDKRATYAEVLTTEQMDVLTVEAPVAGNKWRCVASDGAIAVLPRGHICPVTA